MTRSLAHGSLLMAAMAFFGATFALDGRWGFAGVCLVLIAAQAVELVRGRRSRAQSEDAPGSGTHTG